MSAGSVSEVCARTGLAPLEVIPCIRKSEAVLRRFGRRLSDYVGDVSSIIGVLALKHDPTRPNATKLAWWLEAMVPRELARQLARDVGRSSRGHSCTAISQLSEEELPYEPFVSHDSCLAHEELQRLVRSSLDALPDRDRTVLRMRVDEGLTWREIGERLGVSNQRVGQIEQRALKKLAEHVSRVTGEYTLAEPGFYMRTK